MKEKFYTVFLAFMLLFVTFSMIIFPEASLHASVKGLDTWWGIVFPSLLPFFIAAELLIRFGVVNFIGVLFEPIMRPLFNVPGIGSFAWMVGMASGYPSGAKISAMLREKEQISRIEAERLVAFTNAASPLFMFGAIAVGFFHRPELGILLALSHYAGNILVGLVMRFYQRKSTQERKADNIQSDKSQPMIRRAFQRMHRTRLSKRQPIGEILGESVTASVHTLLMVGGFIILFSVFTAILQVTDISSILQVILSPLFQIFHLPQELIPGLFTGMFEITLGSDMITSVKEASIVVQIVAVSILLGFNGFSIHAQVASILARTDIRYTVYLKGRLMHGIFSGFICWIIIQTAGYRFVAQESLPAFLMEQEQPLSLLNHMYQFGPILTICSIGLAFLFMLYKWMQGRVPLR